MKETRVIRFKALLQEALPAATRFARRLTGSEDGESDLMAEAVTAAFQNFHRLRDESRFKSWLFSIIRNTHITLLRRRKLRPVVPLDRIGETAIGASDPHDQEWLDGVLSLLRPQEREAVVLHYLEGFPVAEAARIARTSQGALNMRLARARKRLAVLIDHPEMMGDSKEENNR
jgi:RNA polymerase sigma-70 factor (ECF subfamily)